MEDTIIYFTGMLVGYLIWGLHIESEKPKDSKQDKSYTLNKKK
jgi:hypothetical protein